MLFISKNSKPKIVATLCVKNEADIIAANIEHHIEQGISQFLITDNNSQDRTKEIAAKYKEVVEIFDTADPTHNQEKNVTAMAQKACKLKPDWIIHLDADEFWNGLNYLSYINTFSVVVPICYNHLMKEVDIDPSFSWKENMNWYIDFKELGYLTHSSKIIHKPDPEIVISRGNHYIVNLGNRTQIPTESIVLHHFPLRNYKHLEFKATTVFNGLISRGQITERYLCWNTYFNEGSLLSKYTRITNAFKEMVENQHIDDRVVEMFSFHTGNVQRIEEFKKHHTIDFELKCWKPK